MPQIHPEASKIYNTTIGKVMIGSSVEGGMERLVNISFHGPLILPESKPSALTNKCANEILQYLSGSIDELDVDFSLIGTGFQKRVWESSISIPYGQTVTYKQLAQSLGCPSSSRAIGKAVKENPLDILIPCHRIVRDSGYYDKTDPKAALYAHFRKIESGS